MRCPQCSHQAPATCGGPTSEYVSVAISSLSQGAVERSATRADRSFDPSERGLHPPEPPPFVAFTTLGGLAPSSRSPQIRRGAGFYYHHWGCDPPCHKGSGHWTLWKTRSHFNPAHIYAARTAAPRIR